MSFLLFALFWIAPEAAANENIRVLLKRDINTAEFAVTQGYYQLVDGGTELVVAEPLPGELWSIFREGLNIKVKRHGDAVGLSFVGTPMLKSQGGFEPSLFRFANTRYRGDLFFYSTDDGLMAINVLDIDDYLFGVLPEEIGSSVPDQALKVQAVVSRTLATYRKGNHPYYDVTAGTFDQVYGGYEAEQLPGQEKIWKAVNETRGEMIYYDGMLIEAVFHSNAGGYTASSQSVWGGIRPYLLAVPSPFDSVVLEYPYQTASGWPANSFQWTKNYSIAELTGRIELWNRTRPNEAIQVGRLVELIPYWEELHQVDNGLSLGRVRQLDVVGTQGIVSLSGDKMRQVFDLRSNFFALKGSGALALLFRDNVTRDLNVNSSLAVVGANGEKVIHSNGSLFVKGQGGIRALKQGAGGYTFIGRGFGHGVGLSQWGAIGMAQAGYNYQEIIEHYYNQGKFDARLQIHP